MKLRTRDVISYLGRDYVTEGIVTYRIGAKAYPLARAVDGATVVWVEPLLDDLDDRLLMLHEVTDLKMATPPPQSISYRGSSYVSRLSGAAAVEVAGKVPDRSAATCQLWRYRAPGDLILQIEEWPDQVVILAGESVHKGMIEILPAR